MWRGTAAAAMRRAPRQALFGIQSAGQLEGLEAGQAFARILQGRDQRSRRRRRIDDLIERYPQHRQALEMQRSHTSSQWQRQVLGHVLDATRAYVVVRDHEDAPGQSPEDAPPTVPRSERPKRGGASRPTSSRIGWCCLRRCGCVPPQVSG